MFIDILFYEARRTTVKIYKINSVSEPIWFFYRFRIFLPAPVPALAPIKKDKAFN